MAKGPVNDIITEIPPHQISFDVEAFDFALRSQGVKLVHYSAIRCPVGMTNLDDNQRPHPDHEGCTNGFLYTKVAPITALFVNNSKHKQAHEMGFFDGSTIQVTFPRFYDETEDRAYIAPFDRFYLAEESITVPTWQLFLHHESGIDRLKYPIVDVDQIVDYTGIRYYPQQDFRVTKEGRLEWFSRRPSPQLDVGPGMGNGFGTDRGAVCSIRYTYRPYWYVGNLLHEIRVTQVSSGNERSIERMPQAALMHREYVANTKDQAQVGSPKVDADTIRSVLGPSYGGFGAK